MSEQYDFNTIEPKWQQIWDEHKTFAAHIDKDKPKYYGLVMFPYPSGAGLHVGHPESYVAQDIICRAKRMQGFNVLQPMGWDAFGLPAENYAIKTGTHPSVTTQENINNFRRQIKMFGISYDWDREVDTTDPKYYKWTQWIFSKLFEKGLAYEAHVPINWCESCKTGLANEEVKEGGCDRCGSTVVRKNLRQWMLKITEYADKLLEGLEDLDWPEGTKQMQRDWIGKSTGADVDFDIADHAGKQVTVYTTRPDTLFGATFMVLAPEHPFVEEITTAEHKEAVKNYQQQAAAKSDLDRTDLAKEKSGVFTGAYALNPVNDEKIPVWIADYVLMSYGTGAIMAVPGHDQRDWEFAKTFDLPIVEVLQGGDITQEAFEGDGPHVNSGILDGLGKQEAIDKIIGELEGKGQGKKTVRYKLRDWVFSRQRYWGEPFPLLHTDEGTKLIPEDQLPLELPQVEKYEPTGTGEGPLAGIDDFINTTDSETGKPAKRESNTMPQWAGSCWYYLRYMDPHNETEAWSKEAETYWGPVDLYIGGGEHAVLHLLYARFWHKVLYDLGHVSTSEPFMKLVHQGIILGEDSQKMSKSLGNVVNPDEVVGQYGADTFRLYEMFMGPLEVMKPWSMKGMEGVFRFVNRVWRLFYGQGGKLLVTDDSSTEEQEKILAPCLKKVTEDLAELKFNTAISAMMTFVNDFNKTKTRPRAVLERFVKVLYPFAPHVGEELWQALGHETSITYEPWPTWDEKYLVKDTLTYAVQVTGKMRGTVDMPADATEDDVVAAAKADEKIAKWLEGKTERKIVFVPGRLINLIYT